MTITSLPDTCPKCNHAESWSVFTSDTGAVLGKCHRAKCGHIAGIDATFAPKPKAKEPRHYTRPYKPVTDDQAAILMSRFELPGDAVDGYSETDDRFILGVTGPQHELRGHIAYSLSGGKPKSLNYIGVPEVPFVHWAMTLRPTALVIVEDWFSAEKVREAGATGIALNGTNLTQPMVTEISHTARNWQVPTYLALDRDAFGKAIGYRVKFANQFLYGLQVWALAKDLKYVTVGRIRDAINNREFNFSDSPREQGSI